MFRRLFAWMNKHERRLSAAAMVGGFVVDQIFFGPVDLTITQAVFESYVAICIVSIALLHWIEARADAGKERPRWRSILPITTQFALGGFWSGFIVFYGRSAAISASWPFLLVLVAILIGNEIFKKYHTRLVFTNILFFFALFSYAIFAVPIYYGHIGTTVFLASGVVAVATFMLFQFLLYLMGHARYKAAARSIIAGSAAVFILINIFYFTSVLPPLPLSLKKIGIYHDIERTASGYVLTGEPTPWFKSILGDSSTQHMRVGESIYVYSSVFAPVHLTTTIVHEWQYYNAAQSNWITTLAISFPITGGNDGGYRGYSAKANTMPGQWRVNIKTIDGRLIGRINFSVVSTTASTTLVTSVD